MAEQSINTAHNHPKLLVGQHRDQSCTDTGMVYRTRSSLLGANASQPSSPHPHSASSNLSHASGKSSRNVHQEVGARSKSKERPKPKDDKAAPSLSQPSTRSGPIAPTVPLYDFDVRIETHFASSSRLPAFSLGDLDTAKLHINKWFSSSTNKSEESSSETKVKLESVQDISLPLSTASGSLSRPGKASHADKVNSQRVHLQVEFVPQIINTSDFGLDPTTSVPATIFAYAVVALAPPDYQDSFGDDDGAFTIGHLVPNGFKDVGHPLSRMDPKLLDNGWIQLYGEVILTWPFLPPPKKEEPSEMDRFGSLDNTQNVTDAKNDASSSRILGILSVQVGLEPIALQYGAGDEAVDGFVDTNLDLKKTSVEGSLGLARAMKVAMSAIVDWKGSLVEIDSHQHTYWDRNESFYDLPPKQTTLAKHKRIATSEATDALSTSPSKRKRKPSANVQRVYYNETDLGSDPRPATRPKVARLPLGEIIAATDFDDVTRDNFLPLDTNIASLLEACRPLLNHPPLYPSAELVPTPLMPYQARCLQWMVQRETMLDQDNNQLMPNWVPLKTKSAQDIFLMRKRLEIEREAIFDAIAAGRPVQRKRINQQFARCAASLDSNLTTPKKVGEDELSLQRKPFIDNVNVKFYYDQVSGLLSLRRFTCRPSEPGGALCESMGLGKTLEVLALIATRPRPAIDDLLSYDRSRSAKMISKMDDDVRPFVSRATLVVCPAALVEQWLDEIRLHFRSCSQETHTSEQQPGVVRYRHDDFAWDLASTRSEVRVLARERLTLPDIIVATYEELAAQLAESHKVQNKNLDVRTPLLEVCFWRIVLDEAQIVSGTSGKATQMVHELWRSNCWMVTGTPITKGIKDVQGIFAFLDHDPFASPRFFKDVVQDPFVNAEVEGIRRLRAILPRYVWRHTKAHVENEIDLPPSESEVLEIELQQVERLFYDRQVSGYRAEFARKAGNGVREVGQTDFLVNLRQLLSHPQIAEQLKFGRGLSRMSFVELFQQFCQKAESDLEQEQMQVVICILQFIWGHDFYDEEPNKKRWTGGKKVLSDSTAIRATLELGMKITQHALDQIRQREQDKVAEISSLDEPARDSPNDGLRESSGIAKAHATSETDGINNSVQHSQGPPTEKANADNQVLVSGDANTRTQLSWEEAHYWLSLLLHKHRDTSIESSVTLPPLEPTVRWDPERPVRTFFEKAFKSANDKSVDLDDPRFHLVVQDASVDDMDEDELMAQIEANRAESGSALPTSDLNDSAPPSDTPPSLNPKPIKKHKALEPGLLKKSRLRGGASQRKVARVWFYKPRERLENILVRLDRAIVAQEKKEHESAFLREKLNEVQLESRMAGPDTQSVSKSKVECLICFDVKVQVGVLPCYHAFCMDCIESVCRQRGTGKCPSCRKLFHINTVTRVVQEARQPSTETNGAAIGDWGAKISGLIADIKARLKSDSTHKAVIFSHWKKMLAFSRDALVQNGIPTVVFGGGEEGQAAALRAIRDDVHVKVILVPFRASAGAAGLTLTSCDLAYLMEPALDGALEAQAIGRIHRIGQLRPTRVIRVKVKDTVEDAVMRIAEERSRKGMQIALSLPVEVDAASDETALPTLAPLTQRRAEAGTELSLRSQSIASSLGSSIGVARDSDATRLSMEEVAMILDFDIEAERMRVEEQRQIRSTSHLRPIQMGFELVSPARTVLPLGDDS